MEEELISLETAKLAKEKGFDIHVMNYFCSEIYDFVQELKIDDYPYQPLNHNLDKGQYWSRPSQSLLAKWLRDIHNIHIGIHWFGEGNWDWSAKKDDPLKILNHVKHCASYEEALEEALCYGLSLIDE